MSKRYGLISFNATTPYTDDRGTARNFNANFVAPPDFSAANINSIAIQSGGTVRLATDPASVCPDPGVSGRRLVFIRQNGGSLSVPIANRTSLVAQAIALRNTINSVTAANPVVCVKLIGEEFPDLFDELSPAVPVPRAPGVSSAAAANGKQNFYSGVMSYDSDAVYGSAYPVSFKLATESAAFNAPALYAAELAAGSTVAQNRPSCPSASYRRSRHYLVQALVTQGVTVESQFTKLPVATHLPVDILAVGQLLAANPAVQCIGYKGEDNDRFHKLLP